MVSAPASRPHALRRDRQRGAHVLVASLAVRARDRPVPHERRSPPALRARGGSMSTAFNHVGQCVTDLERSKRFYVDVFGFVVEREISPTDELSAPLMGLTPPLGLTASYLVRDAFTLELLHYSAPGQTQAYRPRTTNEPGLTHLSLSVDDVDATLARVSEHGGEVLEATNVGLGVFVRDPDGQLVEVLPMSYRERLAKSSDAQ